MKFKDYKKMKDWKFIKEVQDVEKLIYDELHDEVQALGKRLYWENDEEIRVEIERHREAKYDDFHSKYPEYGVRAFAKVYHLILDEGKEIAEEIDYCF